MSVKINQFIGALVLGLSTYSGAFAQTTAAEAEPAARAVSEEKPAPPKTAGEALNREEWFAPVAGDVANFLGLRVESLLTENAMKHPNVKARGFLQNPIEKFIGTVFIRQSFELEFNAFYDAYDPVRRLKAPGQPNLANNLDATFCSLVSENPLEDGLATAFQFHEDKADGYSLHFLIYDYAGPGTYHFTPETKNYIKYVPNALGGVVVTSRQLKGTRSAFDMVTNAEFDGVLNIRELPDGSLFGDYEIVGVGSLDLAKSQNGDQDQFFSTLFGGFFRTASLKQPVQNSFKPKGPAFGMGAPIAEIAPPPGLKVLAKTDC